MTAINVDLSETQSRQIAAVREIWRRVPSHGLGYGVLRYMKGEEGLGRDPDISFNYLGRLGSGTSKSVRFEEFGIGAERDPGAPRRYLIVVEAYVAEDALRIDILYPRGVIEASFVAETQNGMEAWLSKIAREEMVSELSSHLPDSLSLSADDLQLLSERLGL